MDLKSTTRLSQTVSLSILLIFATASGFGAQKAVKSMTRLPKGISSTDVIPTWKFLLHLPSDYSKSGKPWPMIFYLHGRSLRGNDLNALKRYGPPAFLDRTPDFPFVVVSPQLPENSWPAKSLLSLLDEVTRKYHVDRDRIYLTGVSMGGGGAWYLAAADQNRFAAMAPLCGVGDSSIVPNLTRIPIWAFHGDQDKVTALGPHKRLVEAVQKAGGNAKITVIPDGTHGNIIYPTYQRKDLYDWFLAHTRGVAPPPPKPDEIPDLTPVPVKLSTVKGHVVKKGETLWRISQIYKVPLDQLKKANGLKSNIIQIGQILSIPVT